MFKTLGARFQTFADGAAAASEPSRVMALAPPAVAGPARAMLARDLSLARAWPGGGPYGMAVMIYHDYLCW